MDKQGTLLGEGYVVRCFVSESLMLAREGLEQEVFSERLISGVSRATGLTEQQAKFLQHPSWWVLVLEENVIDYVQPETNGDNVRITLKEGVNTDNRTIDIYVRKVLEKYSDWYESRLRQISNSPQAT